MTLQAQGELDALQEVEAQVQAEEVVAESGGYLLHLGNLRFYVVSLEEALSAWPTDQ